MSTNHARATRRALGATLTLLSSALLACDGALDPATLPDAVVQASSGSFFDADPLLGSDEVIGVEVVNRGGAPLFVSDVVL
ncbi:MAG: hypothetical protein FJ207_03180 [Gemmatimonadetes bacterium]|nr:hypothetical protein [Gemmatimonadota bacterium]